MFFHLPAAFDVTATNRFLLLLDVTVNVITDVFFLALALKQLVTFGLLLESSHPAVYWPWVPRSFMSPRRMNGPDENFYSHLFNGFLNNCRGAQLRSSHFFQTQDTWFTKIIAEVELLIMCRTANKIRSSLGLIQTWAHSSTFVATNVPNWSCKLV